MCFYFKFLRRKYFSLIVYSGIRIPIKLYLYWNLIIICSIEISFNLAVTGSNVVTMVVGEEMNIKKGREGRSVG